ncbi:hypothetical protein CBER1_08715 [Cercospora berteroae]|uniref:Uncharacterized protein n=1 Tax=Cercospora berteroae TaxID=357750 RepID=A0A2S6CAD7_9PEZI|nr:hypothetical protein CBER1_08715 [Cercospora berteroae]
MYTPPATPPLSTPRLPASLLSKSPLTYAKVLALSTRTTDDADTMAAFNKIDALLNGLHFTDADVLVQFGEAPTEHAHVHSSLLAAECSNFNVLAAPISFEGIRVFAVAFKYGTCTLEPLTTWSVLSTDAMCHRFHDSSLALQGWSDARDDGGFKGQTARNQNLYAKRQYITILKILYKIPVSLDDLEPYVSRDAPVVRLHSISTSAMETCARAEALGCLEKVADVLIGLILESPLLGQCVAQTPIKFLKLATKVRSKKLYFIASRYLAADPKLTKKWFDGSTYYDINNADLGTTLTVIFGKESAAAKKLLQSLLDVQLCRQHMSQHIQPHLRHYSGPCFECIARTHFAEWLAETLDQATNIAPDQTQDNTMQQTPTFGAALRNVLRSVATAMPFQIFGASSNAHKMLAGELGLRGDLHVEKGIKHYLDLCVKEAATAIEQAFSSSKTELTEVNFPAMGGVSSKATQQRQPLGSIGPDIPKAIAKQPSNHDGDATPSSHTHQASGLTASSGGISGPATSTQPTTAPSHPPTQPVQQARNISPASSDLPPPPRPDQHKDESKWRVLQVALAENSDRTDHLDEGRLPQGLLDELDEPSDERWLNRPEHYHRCCGAKKAVDEDAGAHKCKKVDVKASYHWGSGHDGGSGGICLPGCQQPFGKCHTNQQKRTWIEDYGRCFDFLKSDNAPFASFDYKWKPWNPHYDADRAMQDPLVPTKKENPTDTKRYCAIKAYEGKNCQDGMTLVPLANSWDKIENCFDVFADEQGSPSWAQSMRIECRWGKGGSLFN